MLRQTYGIPRIRCLTSKRATHYERTCSVISHKANGTDKTLYKDGRMYELVFLLMYEVSLIPAASLFTWPRGYKTCSMLNLSEHEFLHAHKYGMDEMGFAVT